MNNTASRVGLTIVAMFVGAFIFWGLLKLGQNSKGPLQNLSDRIGLSVARLEKKWLGGTFRELRKEKMAWFDQYRFSKARLIRPDTLLLGIYDDGTFSSFEPIVELEDSLGHQFSILQFYTAWGSQKDQVFPMLRAQAVMDLGSIPLITWEPWLNDFDRDVFPRGEQSRNPNELGLKAIASGVYDEYIDKWALAARNFRHPFFLRFAHEMNDPYRYPWGPQNNTTEEFVAAWRHVVDRFRAMGAENVLWVWSPHPSYSWIEDYYPGDDYIDWVGLTVLNYGTVAPWSQWWSFDEIFEKGYNLILPFNKPVMITELGCLDVGGDRSLWYADGLSQLPVKYPDVRAVVFFHVREDNTTTYKTLDWSFIRDAGTLDAVRVGLR